MGVSIIKLKEVLCYRKKFIEINDDVTYERCRVQLHRRGVVRRDVVLGSKIKTKKQRVCTTSDFIVAEMDAKFGGYGIIPPTLNGAIVSSHYYLYEINKEKLLPEYLEVIIDSGHLQEQIKAIGSTNYSRISAEEVLEYEVPCPDINLQHAIISMYGKCKRTNHELKSELSHQQTLLKKLRQQILQEAIEGKLTADWRAQNPDVEPASELLKRIAAEKAQLVKEKKIKEQKPLPPIKDEEKPFDLPQSWRWCRLGEITNIVRGGSPRPAGDKRFYEGDIPFLKVADLTANKAMLLHTHTYTIKPAGLHKTRQVPANTLMLTNSGATLGIPKICMFETTFNDGIAAFIFMNKDLYKPFFYHVLSSKTFWFLKEASRGQGQPNLNTEIIGDTLIFLPPLKEQQAIVAKVEKLLALCDQLEARITQNQTYAEQLMQAVLKEAFSQ